MPKTYLVQTLVEKMIWMNQSDLNKALAFQHNIPVNGEVRVGYTFMQFNGGLHKYFALVIYNFATYKKAKRRKIQFHYIVAV